MRVTQFFLSTSKEAPSEAELISHQLMLRAGLIKRLGSGLYTWMPLGLRALRRVEAVVRDEMNRRIEEQSATGHVVVLDIPLLAENPRKGLQGVIVVDVPVDVQVERLLAFRGFDEDDARARISRQATRKMDMLFVRGDTVILVSPPIRTAH